MGNPHSGLNSHPSLLGSNIPICWPDYSGHKILLSGSKSLFPLCCLAISQIGNQQQRLYGTFLFRSQQQNYTEHYLSHQETLLRDLQPLCSDCCSHRITARSELHKWKTFVLWKLLVCSPIASFWLARWTFEIPNASNCLPFLVLFFFF